MKSRIWLKMLVILILSGCGGGSNTPAPEIDDNNKMTDGSIVIPSNIKISEIINPYSNPSILSNNRFEIQNPTEEKLLTIVISDTGDPVLAGWIGDDSNEINVRSTAEVLVFFAVGGYAAPLQTQLRIKNLLKNIGEIDSLAALIEEELKKNSGLFANDNDQLKTILKSELQSAVSVILSNVTNVANKVSSRGLLSNPVDERSGIRINTVSGLNDIQISNRFRRTGFAFVDRVSVFNDDGETSSPKEIARIPIDSVQSLDGGVGTISQILEGTQDPNGLYKSQNIAYVPKLGPSVNLPNVEGAKKTRYRVAIVGAGFNEGDFQDLNTEEVEKQKQVVQEFIVKDFILPLISQIIVPNSDLESKLNSDLAGDLVQDLIGILTKGAPDIWNKSLTGDLSGTLEDVWNLTISQGSVRDIILAKTVDFLFDGHTDAAHAAAIRASSIANSFIAVSGALDVTSASIDLFFVARAYDFSNKADIWTVDSTGVKITLTPIKSKIKVGEFVPFKANVIDAGSELNFEYRFKTNGDFGKLQGLYESGNEVTSSTPFVTYDAQKAGLEYIEVEVLQIVEGLKKREPVGRTTATVKIIDGTVTIEPGISEIESSESLVLTTSVSDETAKFPLNYSWSTMAEKGNFVSGRDDVFPVIVEHETTQSEDSVTYESDPNVTGKEQIFVQVTDASGRLIGEDTAFVKIGCDTTQFRPKLLWSEFVTETTADIRGRLSRGRGVTMFYVFDKVPGANRYVMEVNNGVNGSLPKYQTAITGLEISLFQPIGKAPKFYHNLTTLLREFKNPTYYEKYLTDGKLVYIARGLSSGEWLDDPESIAKATAHVNQHIDAYTKTEFLLTPICN